MPAGHSFCGVDHVLRPVVAVSVVVMWDSTLATQTATFAAIIWAAVAVLALRATMGRIAVRVANFTSLVGGVVTFATRVVTSFIAEVVITNAGGESKVAMMGV